MKEFIRKISSRKLWAAIIGVVVGIAAAFGIDSNEYAQIAGLVTSAVSVIAYIAGEASIDAKSASREENKEIEEYNTEDESNPCGFAERGIANRNTSAC